MFTMNWFGESQLIAPSALTQIAGVVCRRKMIMSYLRKVEMSY